MRFTWLLAGGATLLGVGTRLVAAQNNSFIDGLINQLTSMNLTSLVGAATSLGNSTGGQYLYSVLTSGQPLTFLAPNNDAWAGVNPYFSNDPTWVGQALAYHLLPGNIAISDIPISPDNSVYETSLKDPSLVHLLGGKPQNLGFVKVGETSFITNQNHVPCVILQTATYHNILIHVVSTVVDLPPQTKDALTSDQFDWTSNLTSLAKFAPPNITERIYNTPSITLFAPTNQALIDAITYHHVSPTINGTDLDNLILNHIINGSVVFTGHPQTNYTSAAGEAITVGKGGAYGNVVYYKGSLVANIVHPDIITQNGVLHLIDAVLPVTKKDDGAASSAYSVATHTATATVPVGSPERRRDSRFFRF